MTDDPLGVEHAHEHDDDLRHLLRAADPATGLAPAGPARVAGLLDRTAADPLVEESRTDGTRGRSALTWLVAAAAAVLIAAGGLLVATQDSDPAPPVAADRPAGQEPAAGEGADPEATVTALTVDAGAAGAQRCIAPQQAGGVLASQTVAFDGVVETISGTMVTLDPTRFYAGEETDLVTVTAPDGDLATVLSAVTFAEGGRYLVSATDGRVTLCGLSDAWSPAVERLYERAFGA